MRKERVLIEHLSTDEDEREQVGHVSSIESHHHRSINWINWKNLNRTFVQFNSVGKWTVIENNWEMERHWICTVNLNGFTSSFRAILVQSSSPSLGTKLKSSSSALLEHISSNSRRVSVQFKKWFHCNFKSSYSAAPRHFRCNLRAISEHFRAPPAQFRYIFKSNSSRIIMQFEVQFQCSSSAVFF